MAASSYKQMQVIHGYQYLFSATHNNKSQCNMVQPGQYGTGRLSRIMACFLSSRWTLPL